MTTELEIIDTAIKVGLGAIISGVTTYFVTTRTHSHDIRKLLISEKKDLLRIAATKLESSMSIVNHAFQEFTHLKIGITSTEDKEPADLIRPFTTAYNEGKEARTLFYLIGNKQLGELVTRYLALVEELRKHFLVYGPASNNAFALANAEARMKVRDETLEALNAALESIYA